MLFTFAFPAPWTTVKIKPHQPAISDDKISDKQAASSSLHCVCFVAFVWGFHHTAIQRANLSGRCRLNPTVQTRFPPYSSKIRTWAASLLRPSGWSRKSVIVLLLYYKRTPTLGGNSDPSLWSLCVYTEEQYVVIQRSWKGILNPLCAAAPPFNYIEKSGAASTRHRWIYLSNELSNHSEAQSAAPRSEEHRSRSSHVCMDHIIVDPFPNHAGVVWTDVQPKTKAAK